MNTKNEIKQALIEQRFYNPYDVFQHPPEFQECDDNRYAYEVRIVKWNTQSTRITVLHARKEANKWVFAKKKGQKRMKHSEKLR